MFYYYYKKYRSSPTLASGLSLSTPLLLDSYMLMVRDANICMGTHAHMGEAVCNGPYVYWHPIHVQAAYMYMGIIYAYGQPIRMWAKLLFRMEHT